MIIITLDNKYLYPSIINVCYLAEEYLCRNFPVGVAENNPH